MKPTLKDYLSAISAQEKRELADKAKTSVNYLYQIAHGHRQPGENIILRLQNASNGEITPAMCRPDKAKLYASGL